ncbi:hypothetical protein FAES_4915 [Fibrella aestuarina BUZ 2]|uniref:DinB superfamily protein n=1 Tax=Fibrella aestuarina BUZ 2 TaxID=1166018 RepID=I0KFL1_9BACT|nr:DUF1572 family protein [Fibrella aestuarina]CCH02914.1 hypothetical protein FAES_4915 [Fibrella aestuarina BUZ 2]
MLIETLKTLFLRDLDRLKTELESYQNETAIWKIDGQIANSAGNLCLHLVGNLNTYIGGELGQSGYVRDRPAEFSRKDVPRAELIQLVENTAIMIEQTLSNVPEQQLAEEYPLLVFAEKTSTAYLLVHLTTHLAYHLGQINYHRRLLDQ